MLSADAAPINPAKSLSRTVNYPSRPLLLQDFDHSVAEAVAKLFEDTTTTTWLDARTIDLVPTGDIACALGYSTPDDPEDVHDEVRRAGERPRGAPDADGGAFRSGHRGDFMKRASLTASSRKGIRGPC